MKNNDYIYLNNINNNFLRHAISPKFVNYRYNKLNDLVSPINKNYNFLHQKRIYNPTSKKNFNLLSYNNNMLISEKNLSNYKDNLSKYSALLSLSKNQNNVPRENENEIQNRKNISLNKIQNEIRMIEIKLRSDIIKNKIKKLSDISNDSKYDINRSHKIVKNLEKDPSMKFRILEKNKKRKVYKFKKINNNIYKGLIRNRNIDINNNQNYKFENRTFYKSNKLNENNYLNYSEYTKKNSNCNLEQIQNTNFIKPINIKNEYKKIIKKKIDTLLNAKDKIQINTNHKNFIDFQDENKINYLSRSPSCNIKGGNNNNKNINVNNINLNKKDCYYKNKPKSCNEKLEKNKNLNDIINNPMSQGFYDNYFINNYSIKNINNTTVYNNPDKKINDINEIEIKKYKVENFKNASNIEQKENNKIKKYFTNQKENKIIDFSYINNDKAKKKQIFQTNQNNSIINTVNFSFIPIKLNYNKEINLIDKNKTDDTNTNPQISKNNKNNNLIQNNCNDKKIQNDDTLIKPKKENKEDRKKTPVIHPEELEEKAIILNQSIDNNKNINSNEDNKINSNQKKISFDNIKIIIKYYQDDYIKKSFIFSDNDLKKKKHNFLSTKEHIQNLKKENKKKSILIVKEDKNKIENDKLNLALSKLNELISEVNSETKNNKEEIKTINTNNNKSPFIKKNINFIKKIQEYYKKGVNYRCLSKREIKLLKKNKKNLCYKFQNNPQNFFSEKLCDNIINSYQFNLDDSDLLKNNKKQFIKKKLDNFKGDIDGKNKLNNSFTEEKKANNLLII